MSGALTALTTALRERRRPDGFPSDGVARLAADGLLRAGEIARAARPLPNGPPRLFDLLVATGRGDLAVGRLWEGHVNALGLVARLGTDDQRERAERVSAQSGLIGIWGADDFRAPGRLIGGNRLAGRKTYASGSDNLALAIVLVSDDADRARLVLLDKQALEGRFDQSWWRPLGMEATRSAALDLDGIEIAEADLLGEPDAYLSQPYFGGGAVRFVAVQAGGVLAVWDAMRDHLVRTRRQDDPHQAARLGHALAEAEKAWLAAARSYQRLAPAIRWEAGDGEPNDGLIADAARVAVESAAMRLGQHAIRSVGCAGLMEGHDLERAWRDLTVYLRQPAPDAALARAGIAAASGDYRPAFDAD